MYEKGTIYWLTGLSGAGKTTVGTMLFHYMKEKKDNVVLIDGDAMRKVTGNFDYSLEGRMKQGEIVQRLLMFLAEQGIDVICCVIGMSDKERQWNRENFSKYIEIYLEVSMEELIKRDSKGIYGEALEGKRKDVYGMDLKTEYPKNPDLLIKNEGQNSAEDAFDLIIKTFNL